MAQEWGEIVEAEIDKDDLLESGSCYKYNLRSKKRKFEDDEEYEISMPRLEGRNDCSLASMPKEVLQRILGYISFDDLGKNVRLVNHRFKDIADEELNQGFRKQYGKCLAFCKTTTDLIQATEDDSDLRKLCKLMNMLEILVLQQSMLFKTVVWRYVDNIFYSIHRNCIYAGKLLDQYETFFWKYIYHPETLYEPALYTDYSYPPEVNSIVRLTKLFCLHFEKFNEEPLNLNAFISGCKLVDILDGCDFANKRVLYESCKNGVLKAKYSYKFPNSWFIAMPITPERSMSWEQKQRLMYMRLRRICVAHAEIEINRIQYEREHTLRPNGFPTSPSSDISVYTGYGDVEDRFFYYGTMTEEIEENDAGGDDEEMNDDIVDEEMQVVNGDIDANLEHDVPPYLGIWLDVTLECPVKYGPLNYLLSNKEAVLSSFSSTRKETFSLEMTCQCPGATYLKLPQSFVYKVKHSQ